MRHVAGDWVRSVNPATQQLEDVFVLGVRGQILEYHVTNGKDEWWTYLVRSITKDLGDDARVESFT